LSLLSESEQVAVLKYYHVKDAKMSLASHLLKHLVITKYCNVPWSRSSISRDANGKPCFIPEADNSDHVVIDFNVSHQAGIVSLIASVGFREKVQVGTDVVCADERLKQDYAHIDKSGFFDWVDMHGDVFAESELNHMKLSPVPIEVGGKEVKLQGYGNDALSRCQWRNIPVNISYEGLEGKKTAEVGGDVVVSKKLRRFYAMWCLRETYVKMTGEALLAPWLKELEITEVQPPSAKSEPGNSLTVGDVKKDFAIFFKGRKVDDVKMELTAFGMNYMIGGSIRVPSGEALDLTLGDWINLDIERDILQFAESHI
jgi:4'-phosphopantetheinyl transferase